MTLHAAVTERSENETQVDSTDELRVAGALDRDPRSPARRRRRPMLRVLVVLLLLVGDVAMVFGYGALQSIQTPTFHLDGAFQTASGLLRLQAGDLPGRDFFPYLGIGPVFLLYPVFALSGGVLAGSVLAAWSTTAAVLALLVGVVFALALRARSFAAVLGGAGLLLVALVLGEARFAWAPAEIRALLAPLFEIAIPGNSLRPVRAAAPLILVAVSVLALCRLPRRWGLVVTGAVFGVVVACWSNDFALVPSAVVLAFVAHHGIRARRWRIRELLVLAGSALASFVVSGFAATGGYYLDYAGYNFRDVLGDQFWYFGAWSPQYRVYSPGDLLGFVVTLGATPGIVLLIALAVLVLVRPTLRWTGIAALGWAAFMGCVVAMIGGHFDDYLLPFRVWTVVAGSAVVLALIRALGALVARRFPPAPRIRATLTAVAAVLVIAVVSVGAIREVRTATLQRAAVAADPAQVFVPELGGFVPTAFSAHLADAPPDGAFMEEYAGLWTALRGPNRAQKVDAVIHALGSERAPFARVLADGSLTQAVTTAPQLSAEWVSWNISANWWYYRELLRGFLPSQTSPHTIVWTRSTSGADPVDGECRVAADGQSVIATPADVGLNEIVVDYRGPGRGTRSFSMLENRIDGALDADGYVALDPGARSQSVPIHVSDREPRQYGLRNVPDRRVTTLTGCRVRTVPLPAGSTAEALYASLWATDTAPLAFTDENYTNGLRTASAGFILNRSAPNMADYRVGSQVRLANGEVRTITEATPSYNMLVVYLDGDPLPPDLLDEPTPFEPAGS